MKLRALLLSCGLLIGALGAFGVQDVPEPDPKARWEAKSEADRALLLERFEQLKQLTDEDRDQLRSRLVELKRERQAMTARLSPDERRHLAELPPLERMGILRDHHMQELRRHGEELRADLPPVAEGWLESVMHEGRPMPFHDARHSLRSRIQGRVLDHWKQKGELSLDERAELDAMPPKERVVGILSLQRRRMEDHVARVGLPPGIDPVAWQEVCAVANPKEFMARARQLGILHVVPERRPEGLLDRATARTLRDALRPTLEDRVSAAKAPRSRQASALDDFVGSRLRSLLDDPDWLPELKRGPFANLQGGPLVRALREQAGLGPGGPGGGPPQRRGEGPMRGNGPRR